MCILAVHILSCIGVRVRQYTSVLVCSVISRLACSTFCMSVLHMYPPCTCTVCSPVQCGLHTIYLRTYVYIDPGVRTPPLPPPLTSSFLMHLRGTSVYLLRVLQIKLWSYERSWQRLATYEQHTHYVMQTQWHPRDPNLFASCSLDRTIKVWGLVQQQSTSSTSSSASTSSGGGGGQGSQQQQQGERGGGTVVSSPHFTLVGHERGVNCIEYSKK